MSESTNGSVRVERTYHANGSLAEEVHYLGTKPHGRWRKWHPNGLLASEYWMEMGLYTTSVSREWYPNGQLQGEVEWDNGKQLRVRCFDENGRLLWDSKTSDAKLLRKFYSRATKAKPTRRRNTPLTERNSHEAFVERLLKTRARSASSWLQDASDSTARNLGELSLENSKLLVQHLLSLGSTEILAVEIEDYGAGDETTNHALVQLPDDPAVRGRLFSYVNAYTRNLGFDNEVDFGQTWLYLKVK